MDFIKKILKIDDKSKIYKEFINIKNLEEKRYFLEQQYGSNNEDILTQEKILRNNFLSLGRLYSKNKQPKIENNTYFNLHGTPPNILECEYIKPLDIHKQTDSFPSIYNLLVGFNSIENVYRIDILFLSLNLMDDKINNKLIIKAQKNIKNRVIKFVEKLKGNNLLIQNFILNPQKDFSLEDFEFRYLFIKDLMLLGINLFEEKYFTINSKDIIIINVSSFKEDNVIIIKEFLSKLNQKRFDYILVKRDLDGK